MVQVCAWCGLILGTTRKVPACGECGGYVVSHYRGRMWFCWNCVEVFEGERLSVPGDPHLDHLHDALRGIEHGPSHGVCETCAWILRDLKPE